LHFMAVPVRYEERIQRWARAQIQIHDKDFENPGNHISTLQHR